MSKAMLIMDMPKCCAECVLYALHNSHISLECECRGTKIFNGYVNVYPKIDRKLLNKKQDWCPLREVPEKESKSCCSDDYDDGYVDGYNTCIDEILGGEYEK